MSQIDDRWAAEGDWGNEPGWADDGASSSTAVGAAPPEAQELQEPAEARRAAPTVTATPPPAPGPEFANDERRREPAQRQPRYVEESFPPRRRFRAFLGFLLTLAIIAAGILAGIQWYQNQIDPPGAPRDAIAIIIPNNTSTARIAKILHRNKVIGNSTVFRYWVQFKGKGGFDAGKYQFRTNSSFESVLATLQDGPAVPEQQKLTVPEGFRITQIADRVAEKLPGRSAAKFVAALDQGQIRSAYQPADVRNLEGFLFPETFTFGLDDDEGVIAARMVETFDGVADQLGLATAQEKVGVTPYQALIVASLVEREAKKDIDRPKIARVIYNRLKTDTALQIDAGIIYAMNNGTTRLLNDDYKFDSPYNTYVHKGLPPTPIASPGRASLEAALSPEVGDWLYYVVTDVDGTTSYATTYKEHLRNIKLARKNGVR